MNKVSFNPKEHTHAWLRKERITKTNNQIAEEVGISRKTLYNWETKQMPKFEATFMFLPIIYEDIRDFAIWKKMDQQMRKGKVDSDLDHYLKQTEGVKVRQQRFAKIMLALVNEFINSKLAEI